MENPLVDICVPKFICLALNLADFFEHFDVSRGFSTFYSKPLTYAIALDKLGPDVVHRYVGQEPSGRNFNELILDFNSKYTGLDSRIFTHINGHHCCRAPP